MLFAGCGSPTSSPAIQPAINGLVSCASPVHDFGTVDPGEREQLTHTFVLKNHGSRSIDVSDVKASCGCLTAQLTDWTIPPNGSLEFLAQMNSAIEPGLFEKRFRVYLEGSEDPLLLRLTGNLLVSPKVFSIPSEVSFGTIDQSTGVRSRDLRLARYDGSGLTISRIETGIQGVSAEVITDPGEMDQIIRLQADPSKIASGQSQSQMRLYSHSGKLESSVPVSVINRSCETGFVKSLFIPKLAADCAAQLRFASSDETLSRVTNVEFKHDSPLKLTVKSRDGAYYLHREAQKQILKAASRIVSGELVIHQTVEPKFVIVTVKCFCPP